MKYTLIVITSIIISYLFNSYVYSTFDIREFPSESKWWSSFAILIILLIHRVVSDERIKYYEEEIKKLKK